jgi:hypothetical protein
MDGRRLAGTPTEEVAPVASEVPLGHEAADRGVAPGVAGEEDGAWGLGGSGTKGMVLVGRARLLPRLSPSPVR